MKKRYLIYLLIAVFASSCNSNEKSQSETSTADTAAKSQPAPVAAIPDLPANVIYKNWEVGKPENTLLVLNVYKAWDSDSTQDMSSYFADSTAYDLPDGTRASTTNKTVGSKFRQWRRAYKETTNTPFSLISLNNKDRDQEWVIAWTWNKWTYNDGKKDSMLYCDNWRIKDGKIAYLNSLQNRPSKSLAKKLETIVPK